MKGGADVLKRQIEVVAQYEDQAIASGQPQQCLPESLDLIRFNTSMVLRSGREIGLPDHRPPTGSHRLPALVGDDGQEPGPEWAAGPKRPSMFPCFEGCLLQHVLCLVRVSQKATGEAVSHWQHRVEWVHAGG